MFEVSMKKTRKLIGIQFFLQYFFVKHLQDIVHLHNLYDYWIELMFEVSMKKTRKLIGIQFFLQYFFVKHLQDIVYLDYKLHLFQDLA
jgi:hypothetical protein